MRLCIASVLVCVPLRTIAVNRSRSLSLSHSLRLALLFAELPVRAAWPAWQVTVSANEREIPIALWTNCDCDCLAPVHKLVSALVFSAGAVRCGVCSFSKRTILTYDARFFVPAILFYYWFSLFIGREGERGRENVTAQIQESGEQLLHL